MFSIYYPAEGSDEIMANGALLRTDLGFVYPQSNDAMDALANEGFIRKLIVGEVISHYFPAQVEMTFEKALEIGSEGAIDLTPNQPVEAAPAADSSEPTPDVTEDKKPLVDPKDPRLEGLKGKKLDAKLKELEKEALDKIAADEAAAEAAKVAEAEAAAKAAEAGEGSTGTDSQGTGEAAGSTEEKKD